MTPNDQGTIIVNAIDAREKKRRKRELIVAAVVFLVIITLTWIELKYLGVDSYFFLALFNLNFILVLLILFIVLRNGVKLILERRRKVLGSHLRTRLVLVFMCLSLIPTALMFVISTQFVQTSVDYWFKNQVETSMETALDIGQAFYADSLNDLEHFSTNIIGQIRKRNFAWGGKGMDSFLQEKRSEYNLTVVGVMTPKRTEQNWHGRKDIEKVWDETKSRINWGNLEKNPRFWSLIWPGAASDYAVGVMPVDEGKTGYLVLVRSIGKDTMFKLDRIVRGLDEYKKLRTLKRPLKITLYFILGVVTLLIILGAMWFGFRLAKELVEPILALGKATERISKGDLSVRLEDTSNDELGVLVASFNRMAGDLEHSRNSITDANTKLERQNLDKEQRNRYIEAVLDNTAAGVVSVDSLGQISTINKAAASMFGVSAQALIGWNVRTLLRSRVEGELVGELVTHFQKSPEAPWKREVAVNIGGRELKLLLSAIGLPAHDSDQFGFVAVIEDITELEKMQRMAAWREVARRIAHEIKNPLTPIKLSAQRLQRKYGKQIEEPAFSQCTSLIVKEVEELQNMVQEFSAFAKLPEVMLAPGHIDPLLQELVTLYKNSHSKISWNYQRMNDIPVIQMDSSALKRVFLNVMSNAAEILTDKDNATVTVTLEYKQDLELVRIDVEDNGPGLTQEERSRLFEPYFSHKKGGTGLGLTIVKSIISDHRGYVRANSPAHGGTIVTVELPVV
ncbi:PAS domain-containing sensor histidine kinase [Halodesulfovibrio sp. MK-HDV]|jgi:two-component system, NtrC family, nitrogen regulation sensor histidine kinase NtrY|uniref:sensor histidine kinase n=1 Tax=unclassified Halodesulfovibrio TaxID=2644657 RepID=UPI001370D5A1|nr:ATP-binding protein [Halodesulfovibrio sp. MK-HDV]KAF1077074.1 Sensor protein kinase WalK [Halodesulfovibrio sp. MK-HDV]